MSDPVELLNQLNAAFEAFKTENSAAQADLRKGLDVVRTEKVDRINAEISALQKELDRVNTAIATQRLGTPGGAALDPAQAAHQKAFNQWFRKGEGEAELRDMQVSAKLVTGSDPDGGYVVPEQMEKAIDRVLTTVSAMRGLATVMSISAPIYRKLINQSGATAGWVAEEESRPETVTPRLSALEFGVAELYAQPGATTVALDDASMNLEQWLANEVSTVFAEKEGAAFISGTGVKQPRGLLSYPTVANSSYSWGSLGFTITGAAAAFASSAPADALIDLYHSLKQGYRSGAAWLMSDVVLAAIRKMKDGQGNYLWAPPTMADAPSTILGKPVYTDDNMPSQGANAFPVILADFKRSYLILDRVGIRVLRDPFTSKPNVLFYTTKRVGGGIQNFEAIKLLKCST